MDKLEVNLNCFIHFLELCKGDCQKGKNCPLTIKNVAVKRSLFRHGQIRSPTKLFYSFSEAPEARWPKKKNLLYQD